MSPCIQHFLHRGISIILRIFNINLQEEVALSLVNLIPKTTETKYSIAAKLRKDVSNVHIHTHHKNIDVRKRIFILFFVSLSTLLYIVNK